MANHRTQAQFDRAKWRLLLLAPAWSLQLTLAFGMLGLFSWRLGDTIHHFDARDKAGKAPTIEYVWEITNIVLSLIVAACTIFEIARYMAESLTPWTVLFTHVVKLTCATAILALDVVIYVQRSDSHYSLVGLGMDAVLMVTAISLAIYAIIAYRRLSKYDDYARAVNAKAYGFNDDLEADTSYSSFSSRLGGGRTSIDKRASLGSERLSVGSITAPTAVQPAEQKMRRYSHERDTQFDDYINRRVSAGLKVDSASSGSLSETNLGDSLLSLGATHSRSRGSSISQTMSFSSDHILVSVPEEEGETVDEAAHSKQPDRESLLGQTSQR